MRKEFAADIMYMVALNGVGALAVSPSLSVPGECLSGHSGTLYGPPCHSGPSLPLSTVILLRLPQFVRPLLRPLSLLAIIRPALH